MIFWNKMLSDDIKRRITITYDVVETSKKRYQLTDDMFESILNIFYFYKNNNEYIFKPDMEILKNHVYRYGITRNNKLLLVYDTDMIKSNDENGPYNFFDTTDLAKDILSDDFEYISKAGGQVYQHYDVFVSRYIFKQAYEYNGGDFDKATSSIVYDYLDSFNDDI